METELVIAVLGVVGTLGGSALTYAGTRRKYESELDQLKQERQHERDRGFEKARFGYRKLYEKFMGHYGEVVQAGGSLDALNADYNEIQSVGFKPVCVALEEFWPDSRRAAGELPLPERIEPLRAAIRLHASIQLSQLDEMQRRGEA